MPDGWRRRDAAIPGNCFFFLTLFAKVLHTGGIAENILSGIYDSARCVSPFFLYADERRQSDKKIIAGGLVAAGVHPVAVAFRRIHG